MINLNKYLILKYLNIYYNLELNKLVKITKLSKIVVNDCLIELEETNLIKKNCINIYLTKLGKEVYMKEKIRRLIKDEILKETNALAPFICNNCIYYKEKLEDLCEYIQCHPNKIYILNKK